MHVRRLLGAFSIGLTIAGIGAGGCGGSSFAQPAPDGGHTTADATAPQETGPEDAGADVACAVPINLETIVLPDAALPDDASVGTCLPCARTNCAAEVTACDDDCACKTTLVSFFTCATQGMPLEGCATGVLGEPNALKLGSCIFGLCVDECGLEGAVKKDAGKDAALDAEPHDGSLDASDAATDGD